TLSYLNYLLISFYTIEHKQYMIMRFFIRSIWIFILVMKWTNQSLIIYFLYLFFPICNYTLRVNYKIPISITLIFWFFHVIFLLIKKNIIFKKVLFRRCEGTFFIIFQNYQIPPLHIF